MVREEERKQILFADSRVEDYRSLTGSVDRNTEIVILDRNRDGVEQIAAALKGRTDVAAVHVLSHGAAGTLQLGASDLCLSNIESYRNYLEQWFALPGVGQQHHPELLLYGCNVAAGEEGVAFVERLSRLTGAQVAASDNLTGCEALGGDWDLEVKTGDIETPVVFSQEAREAYRGILALIPVTDPSDGNNLNTLRGAISQANLFPDTDTIDLTGLGTATITLTSPLPRITNSITFQYTPPATATSGLTIDGANLPIFYVDNAATVNLSNLTIANGLSQGTPGTLGGGGGAGVGGALFINNGTVNIDSVTFTNNRAIGGAGGLPGSTGAGGNSGLASFFTTTGNFGSQGGPSATPTGPSGPPGPPSVATGGVGGTGASATTAVSGTGGTGGFGGSGAPGGAGGAGGAGSGPAGPGGPGGTGGSGINGGGGGAGGVGGAGAGGAGGAGGNGAPGDVLGGGGGPGGAVGPGAAGNPAGAGGAGGTLGGGGGSGSTGDLAEVQVVLAQGL